MKPTAIVTLLAALIAGLLLAVHEPNDNAPPSPQAPVDYQAPELRGRGGAVTLRGHSPAANADAEHVPPQSTAPAAADLAEAAVRSPNEAALDEHLILYRKHADSVRQRLARIALNPEERQRTRVVAGYLLGSIDGATLSEGTLRVLRAHLEDPEREIRRQAVLRIPPELSLAQELVPGLSAMALAEPSKGSVAAANVLGRWDAMSRELLVECFSRALGTENERIMDLALESPQLVSLDSDLLAMQLVTLMSDQRPSMAWMTDVAGPGLSMGDLLRFHAALVVASRLPLSTRRRMRGSAALPTEWPKKDEVLARLCMGGPETVTDEEVLGVLESRSPGRIWATLRVLVDQDAISRNLRLPVAQLAFRVSHREGLSHMLAAWLQQLPQQDIDDLLARDGTEYFKWRMDRLR